MEQTTYSNFITELKKSLHDGNNRVWTREDKDYEETAKCEYLKHESYICAVCCEGEYEDLEYYEHYSGCEKYTKVMTKYKCNHEWENNCVAVIYYDDAFWE